MIRGIVKGTEIVIYGYIYWLLVANCSLEELNECEAIFVKRVVRKDSG